MKQDVLEIRINGRRGNTPLTPENFDIKELIEILGVVESIVPSKKGHKRDLITYSVEKGSVRNLFKAAPQTIAMIGGVLSLIGQTRSLDGTHRETAEAIVSLQQKALKNNDTYEFWSSQNQGEPLLKITPETNFRINQSLWVDAEFYFYGTLVTAGGKGKTSIHLATQEYGLLNISVGKDFLTEQLENILYKYYSVQAIGRQSIQTGEPDLSNLKLVAMQPHNSKFDQEYIDSLINKATPHWEDVEDSDKWLTEIRTIYG